MRHLDIDINLGNTCNLRCKYCFESIDKFRTGKMNLDTARKVARFIDRLLSDNPNDTIKIHFWGGEPLLHTGVMSYFMESWKNQKRITYMIFTNGYYIAENIGLLKEYKNKIEIQVSYDFEPCTTNNRLNISGNPVSERIRENIRLLDKENFNYYIKSTMFLNDLESHLFDVYLDYEKFVKTLENKNLLLGITPDTRSWQNWILDYDKIEGQLKKLVKYFTKNKIERTGFTWFDFWRQGKALCNTAKFGCLIDLDGKVYPCHGCSFMEESYKKNFCYLDLMDEKVSDAVQIFEKFIKDFDITEPKKCQDCNVTLCYKCSAHNAIGGNKSFESWNDANADYICKLYKTISKYIWAYQKIKSNGFRR